MAITIDVSVCLGCGCCCDVCAFGALELLDDKATVNLNDCTECKSCIDICPAGALTE